MNDRSLEEENGSRHWLQRARISGRLTQRVSWISSQRHGGWEPAAARGLVGQGEPRPSVRSSAEEVNEP